MGILDRFQRRQPTCQKCQNGIIYHQENECTNDRCEMGVVSILKLRCDHCVRRKSIEYPSSGTPNSQILFQSREFQNCLVEEFCTNPLQPPVLNDAYSCNYCQDSWTEEVSCADCMGGDKIVTKRRFCDCREGQLKGKESQ
jgi:hypothetical protein